MFVAPLPSYGAVDRRSARSTAKARRSASPRQLCGGHGPDRPPLHVKTQVEHDRRRCGLSSGAAKVIGATAPVSPRRHPRSQYEGSRADRSHLLLFYEPELPASTLDLSNNVLVVLKAVTRTTST